MDLAEDLWQFIAKRNNRQELVHSNDVASVIFAL
jgi:hypothetical protein